MAVLGVTALACSRALFALINDPEGPNLLVVVLMAALVYAASVAGYAYLPVSKEAGFKRLLTSILVQVALVAVLYLFLR